MPTGNKVEGVVRVDGKPAGTDEVLLISENMDELLGAGLTDSQGRFALTVPDGARRAIIVAKLRGTTIGLRHSPVAVPQSEPVVIEFGVGEFRTLTGEIDGTSGLPESLDVFVDPVKLQGVPEGLRAFFRQSGPGVRDAYYSKVPVRGPTFTFRLQPGTYRIGGGRVNYDQPLAPNQPPNYVVSAATLAPQNASLPGDEALGFVVEMDQDRKVVLWLRALEDAEVLR